MRLSRRSWILGIAGLFAAVLIGVSLGGRGDETPAPPAVLNRIADKNQDAAIDAAARLKAESDATARAAELRANTIGPAENAHAAAIATNRQ